MNKIYKVIFSKKTGRLVVANEIKSSLRKGMRTLSAVCPAIFLMSANIASANPASGFYTNSIFTDKNGQEILNLNYYGQAQNNGPTVGDGSIGAGENAVSFGAGEYWKPLGNLDQPQYYISSLEVNRGSGAYDGVQWVRGSYWVVGYDEESQAVAVKEVKVDQRICSSWSDCEEKGYSSWANRDLTAEEQLDIFNSFVDTTDVGIEGAVTKWTAVMQRKLVNVAPGEISATSTDAVNGAQLYEIQQEIANGSDYLSVNATDAGADPTTSAKAIGARSTAIGEMATATGSKGVAIGYKSSSEAENSIALGTESKTLREDLLTGEVHGVVSVGSSSQDNGFNRRIINVADGVNASDAATVGQIDKAAEDLLGVTVSRNTDGKLTASDIGSTGETTVSEAIGSIKTAVDLINEGTFGEGAQTSVTQIAQQAAQTAVEVKSSDDRLAINANQADDQSKTTYSLSIKADGTVSSGNTGLVTGGAIFNETRPTNGSYVLSTKSAAENLNALDQQVKTNADSLTLKANADASGINITNWRTALGGGTIGAGSDGFVTGQVVAEETRVDQDGTYIKATNSSADNLAILDQQLTSKASADLSNLTLAGKTAIAGLIDVKSNTDAHLSVDSSIDDKGIRHITLGVNADGTVGGTNDAGIVTGETVEGALNSSVQGILTGISTDGNAFHTAIRNEAKDAVKFKLVDGEEALILTTDSTQDSTTYSLGLQLASKLEDGSALPVSSGLVFTELGKVANAEITDANIDAWQLKLGDGTVTSGNSGLVTGGTVAQAIHDSLSNLDGTEAGNAVAETAQKAINIKAADGQTLVKVSKFSQDSDGSNLDTYTIDLALAQDLSTGKSGLITADVLRNEVRSTKDGTYVLQSKTVGENLLALDSSLSGVNNEINNLRDFDNLSVTAIKNLNSHVASSFTIQATEDSPLNVTNTVNDQTGVKTWTIDVNDSGKIEEGNTNLVTGDTVWDYVKDFTTGAGFAAIDASNITVDAWHARLGTQVNSVSISASNSGFVTGQEVFNEVRVPDTPSENSYSYLSAENTAAANMIALDKGLTKMKDLEGLTDVGKEEIGKIAADAIKLTAGNHVDILQDDSSKAWTISVKDTGKVAENDVELVTGGTVWSYVSEATSNLAAVDAGNIQTESWLAALGTSSGSDAISSANSRFVTGAEIHSEVRPVDNGHYVATSQSTGDNLLALDQGLFKVNSTVFDGDGNLKLSLNDLSNLTDDGKSVISLTAQNAVKVSSESSALTITPTSESDSLNYVLSLKTSDQEGADSTALVTSGTLEEVLASQSGEITENLAGKADVNAANITGENLTAWQTTLANNAAVAAGNNGLISGGMLFTEVRPTEDGRFVQGTATTATNLSALDESLSKVLMLTSALSSATDGFTL